MQSQNHVIGKTADTITKDIPHDTKGNPLRFYHKKAEMEKKVELTPLENGFDSLQIRIWYGVALRDSLQLLILKKSDSKWSAELYSLRLNYDKNRDSLVSVTKSVEIKQPVSGWENLADSLAKLDIYTLPDAHEISSYSEGNDGYGVTVEFATKRRYRIYNYPSFNEQTGVNESRKVEQIIELIEKDFSFKRLSAR
jgi:hypothetical protein